ncbi:hypothetical protein EGR_03235 [Echinococcus granulosus]|uniref:Uncharacterized protein n=1 Tax=Echinococcus granulosus TaxID=6210 RepID=W6UUE1_ECHGR|nr:hypothetical protein EGR_03235 [Echinococcus granulosus]EUB61962.1 hypothetical protein EGR_03235 [Echinococcus granulosus]
MWLVNCLCITSFIFALLFYPVLSQIATNDSDAQKSKRSPLAPFGLGDSPAPGDTSSINWRLSLGNINTTHVDFAPTASRSVKQHFRNKGIYVRVASEAALPIIHALNAVSLLNTSSSWRPEVRIIGDNLAVNLSWPSRNSQQRQLSHYRIQFRYREPHERRWDRPFVVVQTRLSGRRLLPLRSFKAVPGCIAKCGWEMFDILSTASTDSGDKAGISCLRVALLLPASCAAEHSRTRAHQYCCHSYADAPTAASHHATQTGRRERARGRTCEYTSAATAAAASALARVVASHLCHGRVFNLVREPYMYVTNKQPGGLEAGKVYQFQVVAVFVDAQAPEEKSRWSAAISFDYISPEPPLVRVARRLPDGAVHIKWSRPWRQSDFKITRFIILFRKEKRLPGGETAFHGFRHITALGNLEVVMDWFAPIRKAASKLTFVATGLTRLPLTDEASAVGDVGVAVAAAVVMVTLHPLRDILFLRGVCLCVHQSFNCVRAYVCASACVVMLTRSFPSTAAAAAVRVKKNVEEAVTVQASSPYLTHWCVQSTFVHTRLHEENRACFSPLEYKVTRLDRSAGYQFVVYGENTPEGVDPSKALFTGGLNGRRITAFSQEVFVPMAVVSHLSHLRRATATKEFDGGVSGDSGGSSSTFNNPPSLLDMNTTSSNSLMFLILGVLAGAMLIVMTFLIAICFFRQRKEKLRLLAQVNDKDIRLVAGPPGASGGSNEVARGGGGAESVGSKAVAPKGGTGFLLSELTPIAVANFRTASTQLTSVAEERESLLLPPPQPPPPPLPPFSACESCPSGSSTTAPSEFNAAVMEMKREPPSGGSIHEESDDDTAKHAKDTVGASTPPSTHKSVFFTQIPFHLRAYPLRNFHLHRRPPSPALGSGSGLQRSSRSHPHGCSHDELTGWGLAAEASGARLSRLGSRTFAYPSSITSADDWLAGRHACSTPTHFPHLTSRGLSPPPQRIQAIVPQVDRNEVKGEVKKELEILQNLRGCVSGLGFCRFRSDSGCSIPIHSSFLFLSCLFYMDTFLLEYIRIIRRN